MGPSGGIDNALLPAVREAQGKLLHSIFSHQAFEQEGDIQSGKLFYVFEETVANNDALEVAHLGDDVENATKAALEIAVENAERVIADAGTENTELFKLAKTRYAAQGKDADAIQDIDLGNDLRASAAAVKEAANRALGR